MVKKGKGFQTKYLYPVKALSKVFRAIFLRLIQDEQELSSQVDKKEKKSCKRLVKRRLNLTLWHVLIVELVIL